MYILCLCLGAHTVLLNIAIPSATAHILYTNEVVYYSTTDIIAKSTGILFAALEEAPKPLPPNRSSGKKVKIFREGALGERNGSEQLLRGRMCD